MGQQYCGHGLVQRDKFGMTRHEDGTVVCNGCGLPTFESVFAAREANPNFTPRPSTVEPPATTTDRLLTQLLASGRKQERLLAAVRNASVVSALLIGLGLLFVMVHGVDVHVQLP